MTSLLFLEAEAQADSWHWLLENSKRHAQALQADIDAGATLEQITAFVDAQYPFGSELARHLPQAAAHLIRERELEDGRS